MKKILSILSALILFALPLIPTAMAECYHPTTSRQYITLIKPCEDVGLKVYKCTLCGYIFSHEFIPKLEGVKHNLIDKYYDNGYTIGTCTRCQSKVVRKHQHEEPTSWTYDKKLKKDVKKCEIKNCNHVIREKTHKHTWTVYTIINSDKMPIARFFIGVREGDYNSKWVYECECEKCDGQKTFFYNKKQKYKKGDIIPN